MQPAPFFRNDAVRHRAVARSWRYNSLPTHAPWPTPPNAPNHVWAIDFVSNTCADRRHLKCLTVVDEWTRECLAIDVTGGIRAGRVVDVLSHLVSVHGAPRHLRSDNGPEFV